MKIKGSIDIKKPRAVVVHYFADPKYLSNYQDGFIKKELISGEPGKEGAVSKMNYRYGKREMELIETITTNNLPDRFAANYVHKQMENTMVCTFTEINDQLTRYNYEVHYTLIKWFMPKLMALLFPSVYRKQIEKWMSQFKSFVEDEG
ncbi:MAG: SRPBCC family protein [Winogradskyella sp.]|nr:SRPBCC family protein [Winogradskyella sp.]